MSGMSSLFIVKQTDWCYLLGSPKTATTEPMRLILLFLVFVSSILLAGTTASAGISTKRQDILKLIGTTYAPNGKFAWIELNKVVMWVSTELWWLKYAK